MLNDARKRRVQDPPYNSSEILCRDDHLTSSTNTRAKVVKVEMDKNQQTAMAWRVRAAPTLLLFKNGAVQATHVGMASKAQLAKLIEAAL